MERLHVGVAFRGLDALDHCFLDVGREQRPAPVEPLLVRHDRGDLVALQLPAGLALLVEAGRGVELQDPFAGS